MKLKETVLLKETVSLKDMLKNRVMLKDMLQNRKSGTSLEIGGRLSGFISWIQSYRQIKISISSNEKGWGLRGPVRKKSPGKNEKMDRYVPG